MLTLSDLTDARAGCEQRAYLWLERAGDVGEPPYSGEQLGRMAFDPGRVTELVGLAPTDSARRGDPRRRPNAPAARFSRWEYSLPVRETSVTEDVVTALLDAVEPHADGIATACRELGLQAGIMVVITLKGYRDADGEIVLTTAATGSSSPIIQRLARLGLSLEHDQYVHIG